MAEKQPWVDRINRVIAPIVVIAIGAYGTWDVVVKPWLRVEQPIQACSTVVTGVFVNTSDPKTGKLKDRLEVPEGLPAVVTAGETRTISVEVDNPESTPVIYQWRATYGQFQSRVTTENQSVYVAPSQLVNDTLTMEVKMQGCTVTKRTIKVAIVPSPNMPLPTQPLPTNPNDPFAPPSPLPTLSPTPAFPGQPGQ
jgi:hypothetical protein